MTSDLDRASLFCVEDLLSRSFKKTDTNAAGMSSSRAQRFQHLLDLRKVLKTRVETGPTAPVSTAPSRSRRDEINSDTDFIKPSFTIGMDDHVNNTTDGEPDC